MEQTLLLNATYEPLKVVHWQKAMTLWCQGKVEVISVYDTGRSGRSRSASSCRRSSACCATSRSSGQIDYVPFSRANIYARDDHSCQYCGEVFPTAELTFDHVVPVAQGGRKDWENIVTCCITLQPPEGRPHARARPVCTSFGFRNVPTRRPPSGSRSAFGTLPTAGAITSTGTWSSTRPDLRVWPWAGDPPGQAPAASPSPPKSPGRNISPK